MDLRDNSPAGPPGVWTRSEIARILGLASMILAGVGLYIAASIGRDAGQGERSRAGDLLPYQRLARTLSFADQATFQEIQDALPIIEAVRSRTGRWPEASTLVSDGVSPFGAGPVTGNARFAWGLSRNGLVINYLGIPADPALAAWLLVIVEPDPAAPPDTAANDEEHHRLDDGTVLHVSIWRRGAGTRLTPGFVLQPQANGWTQLFDALPAQPGR